MTQRKSFRITPLPPPASMVKVCFDDRPWYLAAIALGSNLGDRALEIQRAADEIDMLGELDFCQLSSLYESAPWGDTDQPAFLNAVVIVRVPGPPQDFLEKLQEIEVRLGKQVLRKWGPRVIDLDLLLFGDQVVSTEGVEVPHPRIRDRPFVYEPLREVCEAGERLRIPSQWQQFLNGTPDGIACEASTKRLPRALNWPSRPMPPAFRFESDAEELTMFFGNALGRAARPGDIIALCGPLGAGKSCLARGIAKGLGISGPIQSPTFTFCREYDGPRGHFQHWDFYRLEGGGDLESTGFEDKMHEKSVFAIEWANLFENEMPADRTTWIHIDRTGEGDMRMLTIRFAKRSLHLRNSLGN